MIKNIVVASPGESIFDCARKMAYKGVSSLLIVNGTSVVGIITEQDVARKVVAKDLVPRATPVSVVMSQDIYSVNSSEDLQRAIEVMGKNEIKHLPVMDNGELVGIIGAKDIVAIEPLLMDLLRLGNSNNETTEEYLGEEGLDESESEEEFS